MDDMEQAERLANTYADAILRLSYTYLKNTHDAQDICQTVFVKLLMEPREFKSPEHERAYILRMAANACKDLLKSPWRQRSQSLDVGLEVPAPQAGDGSVLEIVYTISRDDGTRLLPEDITGEMLLVHGNGTDLSILGGSHGSSYFVVEDPAASSIQMVETVSADKPINDCTATGVFENLYKWDEEAGEAVPIIEGKWRLKFEMTYEDSSVTLSGGETFTQDGMTFTIDSITLSPVAYKVDYTVDSEVVWSNSGSGRQSEEDRLTTQRYFENVEILLTLTDGTVINLSNAGGSIGPEDGVTVCSKGQVFSEVLPMEDMASISVGGVVYDLTAE